MSDECGRERSVGERSVRGVGVREVSEEWECEKCQRSGSERRKSQRNGSERSVRGVG